MMAKKNNATFLPASPIQSALGTMKRVGEFEINRLLDAIPS